jgi:hypothetical protein
LPVIDRRDSLDEELALLRADVQKFSSDEIDLKLAELSFEVEFLEAQLPPDLVSYSRVDLDRANRKISHFKRRVQILKTEIGSRKKD